MQRHSLRRTVTTILVMMLACVTLLSVPSSFAQGDGDSRRLGVGQAVSGTLDTENFAQTYIFDASAGNSATITATSSSEDLSLALLLTDPNGEVIAADGDLSTATVASLSNVDLETNGTYVVTILRGTGADGDASGDYTLALTGTITPPPDDATGSDVIPTGREVFVELDNGTIDIELAWTSAVDFNLEVRDPVGGAIYWENAEVNSGGQHGGNTNQECDDATANNPTETVTWGSSSVPVGSYEILVYYQQGCSVGGPQSFTLSAAVNGDDAEIITGVLNPGQVYLARVELNLQKTWSLFNGGVNAGLDVSQVADAQPIALGETVTGAITNSNVGDAYTFNASSGDNVVINLSATSGSLDTLLILLNANGQRIADNDDVTEGTTNSGLNTTIGSDGSYTLIATRYGQTIGGTEGGYSLSVGTASDAVDNSGTDTSTTPIATSTLPNGSVEIRLDWSTDADLQLLVRDPRGEAIFDDNTTASSGGILNAVGNQNCTPATTSTPTSYVYWPDSRTPPNGAYEVEVWYQSECNDTRLVNFQLSVEVDGQSVFTTTQTPTVGSRFMVTFNVLDGAVTVGEDGFFDMRDVVGNIDIAAAVSNAQPIELDSIASGTISQDQKFIVYSFEARAGDRIGVNMQATSGSLDTALFVIGPSPSYVQLSFNDDVEPGVETNSRISSVTLNQDGTYYIIATHYGLRFGGTAGNFSLNLARLP